MNVDEKAYLDDLLFAATQLQEDSKAFIQNMGKLTASSHNLETHSEGLTSATKTLNQLMGGIEARYQQAKLWLSIALGVGVVVVLGSFWYGHSAIKSAQYYQHVSEVLSSQEAGIPALTQIGGHRYIRIVPGSEVTLSRKDGQTLPGQYAKVWSVK